MDKNIDNEDIKFCKINFRDLDLQISTFMIKQKTHRTINGQRLLEYCV